MSRISVGAIRTALKTGQQRLAAGAPIEFAGACVPDGHLCEAGDILQSGQRRYRIVQGLGARLYPALIPAQRITRPVHLHAGLHKSLTMFTRRVYHSAVLSQQFEVWNWAPRLRFPQQKHVFHNIVDFYELHRQFTQISLSGQRVDLDSFADIRVVRFVRDPRDLLVSGYHYHKRGAEHWCKITDATHADYEMVNGAVPDALARAGGLSLEAYLTGCSIEEGVQAEYDFRRPHFDTMASWPLDDPRIKTFRYEDIIGREADVFGEIGAHLDWSARTIHAAQKTALEYSIGGKEAAAGHVRNKAPGQWRQVVPAALNCRIVDDYGDLLSAFGYPTDQ